MKVEDGFGRDRGLSILALERALVEVSDVAFILLYQYVNGRSSETPEELIKSMDDGFGDLARLLDKHIDTIQRAGRDND